MGKIKKKVPDKNRVINNKYRMSIIHTSASLIPKFVLLKQAACFVTFYFYKHVTVKQAKYLYVKRNIQDILTYST
jgi:hypothetical protein